MAHIGAGALRARDAIFFENSSSKAKEAEGKSMQKCEHINDLGTTVNLEFTPSSNVLTATNKTAGIMYFMKANDLLTNVHKT